MKRLPYRLLLPDSDGLKSVALDDLDSTIWKSNYAVMGMELELYTCVPWLRRAVDLRADAVSEMPYDLEDAAGNIIDDPHLVFPWWDDFPTLLEGMEADRVVFGAAYLLIERNRRGAVLRLRRLLPASIRLRVDDTQGLVGFERHVGGRVIAYDVKDIVYSWTVGRDREIGPGPAPLAAALIAAGILKNIGEMASGFFERGALYPVLISVREGIPSAEERERLEGWFRRLVTGVRRAFSAVAVSMPLEVQQLGTPLGELAAVELIEKQREEIATALGVPQTILFSNAANYATAQSDWLGFYDTTVLPEARRIEADLNRCLFVPLGYRLRFAPERLEVFQRIELERAQALAQLVQMGIMQVGEAREELGLPPLEAVRGESQEPPADVLSASLPAPTVEENMAAAELRRWRRMARKRYKEGAPDKALDFETEHIPDWLAAEVRGLLELARTSAEVGGIFDWAQERLRDGARR